jgi:pimeloyl-ACP methyl ester carboxylesterase
MASHYHVWKRHNIHYRKSGLGDPILLIHNLYPGASYEEFEHNIQQLASRHTVYALDLLGFGDSDAPRRKYTAELYIELIKNFCHNVIGERTNVMSAGLSCAYISQAAADEPELFDRIIFICPRSEPTGLDFPRWAAPIRHFMMTAPGVTEGNTEAIANEYTLTHYLRTCFHNPKAITGELVEQLRYNAARPGSMHAYAGLMVGYLDWPLLDSLPRVQNAILLIWGRQARPTPVEHSVRLVALARRCNLRVIEAAGAWTHHEQSAQVNRLVEQFLNGEMVESTRAETA